MRILSFLTLMLLLRGPLPSQEPDADARSRARREKIERIMEIQDRRTVHDGKLISFFSDSDPTVRERAVRSCGSIQDTALLPLLVERLADADSQVQASAAFAIGQTAGHLSKTSRATLEHDLIWTRLATMRAQDRLIEEIGKFGGEAAMDNLIILYGESSPRSLPLTLSIARFAIRGVITPDAIRYLLRFTKSGEPAPWQVIYALQRIGNKPELRAEVEHLVQLSRYSDPIARMHLATLLGRLKDEQSSLEPLSKLAEFDGDWRVRVNALKALGSFPLQHNDQLLRIFRQAVSAENRHVSITALTTIGASGISLNDSTSELKQMGAILRLVTENANQGYPWQIQAEAAHALAKLEGSEAVLYIHPEKAASRLLQAQLLTALGASGSPTVAATLVTFLGNDDAALVRAALEGLQALAKRSATDTVLVEQTYAAGLAALGSRDVAVATTAASLLGDSLFLRQTSVDGLIASLQTRRVPDDVEAIQEILATLGKLKNQRAVESIERVVRMHDYSVAVAAASALKAITGTEYKIPVVTSYEPMHADLDVGYLRTLPGVVRVKLETIYGDVHMTLFPGVAPFTVMSFLKLATQRGFYRGLSFHRVVPNFVVQGGDPRGDGWGGPGYAIRSEFSELTYETGTLGVASAGKDTEGSQFFITQSPHPHLDGRYTIFGKVVSGMEIVDRILVGDQIYDIKIVTE